MDGGNDGSFLLPKHYLIIYIIYNRQHSLLVLLLSVYVKLSKNSLLCRPRPFLSESGCKGTTFFRTTKTFQDYFYEKAADFLLY